jgi:hypothetical protein
MQVLIVKFLMVLLTIILFAPTGRGFRRFAGRQDRRGRAEAPAAEKARR